MHKKCKSRLSILGYVITFLLVTACNTTAPTPQPDSLAFQLDALVPRLLKQHAVPGAALAVIRDSAVIWSQGYGLADIATDRPVTVETRFQVGSVSKSLTAWGIMTLAEHGLIDLDAPVDRYLKRWHLPAGDFDRSKVTIRRILSHTAGLSVKGYHGVFTPNDQLPTLEESLAGYNGSDGGLHIIQEPGTSYQYSSGGFTLLQLVLEDVTGEPFAKYMQRAIFEPLGMTHSGYTWSAELQAAVATPYAADGTAWPQYQYAEQGSGGFYTTAADLARFVAAAMPATNHTPAGRGILRPETVQQMIAPADHTGRAYGLGYEIMPLAGAVDLIGHRGANEGWRALFLMYPPTGDGLVILTNSDAGPKVMAEIVCTWSASTTIDLSALCSTLAH